MAWIRSQDRKTLINVIAVWVEKHEPSEVEIPNPYRYLLKGQNSVAWSILGEFPSETAALEELDDIERWIAEGGQDVHQVAQAYDRCK